MTGTRIKPEAYLFTASGGMPNNSRLPLLVYRGVLDIEAKDPARSCEELFTRNRWPAAWRDGVYDHHHFHTTAHEALGIVRGDASVRFGGPNGRTVAVRAGDVVVIPAGVGHRNEGASPDLVVIGAYPKGQNWDICPAGERDCEDYDVGSVPLPEADPVYGADGPLIERWR